MSRLRIADMDEDELMEFLMGLARLAAKQTYERNHPGCDEEESLRYMRKHWQKKKYLNMACTFVAVVQTRQEQEEIESN
jgi:hypothetical protein